MPRGVGYGKRKKRKYKAPTGGLTPNASRLLKQGLRLNAPRRSPSSGTLGPGTTGNLGRIARAGAERRAAVDEVMSMMPGRRKKKKK